MKAPTYRIDAEVEADLIEEIARMNGLEALPDVMPSTKIVPEADDSIIRAASFCVDAGVSRVYRSTALSFTAPAILDAFSPSAAPVRIRIAESGKRGLFYHARFAYTAND